MQMKRITNERYQETYYTETLENGLRVVLWHKPGYARSLFMMATPLGAMDSDAGGCTGKHLQLSGRHRTLPGT